MPAFSTAPSSASSSASSGGFAPGPPTISPPRRRPCSTCSAVRIDDEGAVQPDDNSLRGNVTRGVKIVFAGSDGEARTLYYFSTNLADDGVRNSKFLKFCETLAPGGGLIKSAYYLPHSGGFT